MKRKPKLAKKTRSLTKLFLKNMLVVFACFLFTILIISLIPIAGPSFEKMPKAHRNPITVVFVLLVMGLVVGALVSFIKARNVIVPLSEIEKAMIEISKGNFNVQVKIFGESEFNDFIDTFNKMAKELKNNETLKSDFISNVSHEFKTPLSVIQSYSKMLKRSDIDEETKKHYLEVLENNVKKLTTLTSNILSLSKIENQEIVINKSEFLLDEQIRQVIVLLEPEWKKKNILFKLNLPKTKFYGSSELLEQVWQNLISNAIKFSNDGGKITIIIVSSEDSVEIKIADYGSGMNPVVQARIFEKFYQGDTSHSKEGNGLGLALVNRIVKISDGKIDVYSKEGEGSTFVVTLKKESPPQKNELK